MVAFFARHPTAANLLMIAIAVLGYLGASSLTRETMPDFVPGFVGVRVPYPGASAEEVEETVCQRIEESLEGIEGIERIESESIEGMGSVILEAADGYDVVKLLTDTENAIDQIDDIPDNTEEPMVWEMLEEDRVVSVTVYADIDEKGLYALADTIKKELLDLEGVSQVDLKGFSEHQIRIEVQREALLAYGMTVGDIARVIGSQSVDLPAGSLETNEREIKIRVVDQKRRSEDFRELVVVSAASGAEIPLGSIATITDTFENDWQTSTFNGKRAATLIVEKSDDGDSIKVSGEVRRYMEDRKDTLPPGVEMEMWADISSIVKDRLATLSNNGWLGFVLVLAVLWLFLDIRLSFWVAVGIPISFFGAFYLMSIGGMSLNMITMVSLILALGIVVDDAIVIGENIYEHRERGAPPLQAAIEGTRQVAPGVVSSMLTTIAVFLPLMLMEGEMGKVLRVMPFGVIAALAVSLAEGFLILPNHLAHSLKGHREPNRFRRLITTSFDGLVQRVYAPILRGALKWRLIPLVSMAALFLLAVGLIAGGRIKFKPFPDLDGDVLVAHVLLPMGTDLDRTRSVVNRIENALVPLNEKHKPLQPEGKDLIRNYSATYGANAIADEQGSHAAMLTVELLKADSREGRCEDILRDWRELVGEIPDVVSVIYEQLELGPGGKAIDIQLVGQDLDELKTAGLELQDKIRTYPGVKNLMDNLRPGKMEAQVRLKEVGRSLGVTSADLARQIRSAFWHEEAEEFQRGEDTFDVDVKLDPEDRASLTDLDDFLLVLPGGAQVPFHEVARVEEVRGYSKIVRVDGKRSVSVQGGVDSSRGNSTEIMNDLTRNYFPEFLNRHPGVSLNLEGEQKESAKTSRSMMKGMVIGFIIIFLMLSFVFESYADPFVIMLAIPLGLIGAVFGHLVMGIVWTMPSMVGFISLSGIIVNDSIILVVFIKSKLSEGLPPAQAIYEAGIRRFRPVFLTSATTVAGLTPMLLETSLQAQVLVPLVVSISFGLMFATALTLILTPCVYSLLIDIKGLIGRGHTRKWAGSE